MYGEEAKQAEMKRGAKEYRGPDLCSPIPGLLSDIGDQPSIVPSIRNFLHERADAYRTEAHRLETMARNLPGMSQEFAKAFWESLIQNR